MPRAAGERRPVPHFFFDFTDGETIVPDTEGSQHDDEAAAQCEAASFLLDMAQEVSPDVDRSGFACDVRTDEGRVVRTVVLPRAEW